jgi:putative transposase
MQEAVTELARAIGITEACRVLDIPRSTYYRSQPSGGSALNWERPCDEAGLPVSPAPARRRSVRALSPEERTTIRAILNSERFADSSPREVYATLLDEGRYLCSWPTMYRILREADEVRRRRDQARQSSYSKPELMATQPNQLWSWDITKLKGATTWTYHSLYVIIDVYSRYVVGWMLAERETAELAEAFIAETCAKEGIMPGTLTLHADRGSAMTSKCVVHLLADLGVVKTHSRPQVSNDNPFSEAQFKTVKYHPSCPERFGSVEDARVWARRLFEWYNHDHHHTGIGLLTPVTLHQGKASEVLAKREEVLSRAYEAHPERFVRGRPRAGEAPKAVWINPPAVQTVERALVAAIETDPTSRGVPSGVAVSRGEQRSVPLTREGQRLCCERPGSVHEQTQNVLPKSSEYLPQRG